jgi:hypothetical protein
MYMRSEVSITRGGEPSYEAGIAHGGPIIDEVFGYRASVWYRYDGGWIDRIDPTTQQTVDKNANHANTVAARLAFLIQPKEGLRITPSIMFQNSRKHDFSTYWPAYTDVSSGNFKNATPERLPDPDRYYLPALKIEADLGPVEFIFSRSGGRGRAMASTLPATTSACPAPARRRLRAGNAPGIRCWMRRACTCRRASPAMPRRIS